MQSASGTPGGSGPSRSVVILGPLSRRINSAVLRLAGRRRSGPVVRIHHLGRRSGKPYVAPVLGRPDHAGFLVPLFFGSEADWCRNVLAAGGCSIEVSGRSRAMGNPRVVAGADVRAQVAGAFPRRERVFFRVAGITEFMLLDAAPDGGPLPDPPPDPAPPLR